jgi:vancomycin resistance protein YoaR
VAGAILKGVMITQSLSLKRVATVAAGVVAVLLVMVLVYGALFSGRVLPGVQANGITIGGLSKAKAESRLSQAAQDYAGQQIPVQYNQTTLRVPVSALRVDYSHDAANAALKYGRSGDLLSRLSATVRSIFGRSVAITNFQYADEELTPFLDQIDEDAATPVTNAHLSFSGDEVTVSPSESGKRVDRGRLVSAIDQQLAGMKSGPIVAPVYELEPSVKDAALEGAKEKAKAYVASPIEASAAGQSQTITQDQILSWISVNAEQAATDMAVSPLQSFYDAPLSNVVTLALDKKRVEGFVATLAGTLNRKPQDAELTIQNGKVVVTAPSRDGVQLDQTKAVQQILAAMDHQFEDRKVSLATETAKAAVREDNFESLGLKELIGQGTSSFPGSSADRLTNVRVGTARYQNVLIKPGEVFSFGARLGDVGPAQGYKPSLVIIGNKEEKEYGGGLCQVSSTLYRAALTAGLPIVQRTNHAFAINEFYTAPYGVPGVDATIYYPQVDLKFKNDTPGYILIQTQMTGNSLKFDMYGTKTKSGVIRGPYFVSGSMDATKPSKTVFYRDVLDMDGKVVKTDTTFTSYKSSLDFTITETKQYN